MTHHSKALLESKLTLYLMYYQAAEKREDRQRMEKLENFIDETREEIEHLD